ncbi:hypothetical protein BHE74_00050685 [Ensete ventricosum]|nr:hypothetical protein BHE74_00050685 [Ensete ventricosum]RZS08735.1 hypothetical protein BHM03_00039752 [Ensete ventricosum]
MSHDAIPRATCVLESMIWHASKSDAGDAPGRDPRGRPDEKSSLPGWCLGPDDGMGEYDSWPNKGRLRDGKFVAVKVLSSESKQGAREFLTEITVISGIIHENLVKLYGCCVEGTHRILVYNYCENNSLAQTLLGSSRSSIQLNWRTRAKICVGIARGLAFLHEEVRPHVVHRDIKASNILLDKDLTPKISDFGLAKLLPANVTHVSTKVAGTM